MQLKNTRGLPLQFYLEFKELLKLWTIVVTKWPIQFFVLYWPNIADRISLNFPPDYKESLKLSSPPSQALVFLLSPVHHRCLTGSSSGHLFFLKIETYLFALQKEYKSSSLPFLLFRASIFSDSLFSHLSSFKNRKLHHFWDQDYDPRGERCKMTWDGHISGGISAIFGWNLQRCGLSRCLTVAHPLWAIWLSICGVPSHFLALKSSKSVLFLLSRDIPKMREHFRLLPPSPLTNDPCVNCHVACLPFWTGLGRVSSSGGLAWFRFTGEIWIFLVTVTK